MTEEKELILLYEYEGHIDNECPTCHTYNPPNINVLRQRYQYCKKTRCPHCPNYATLRIGKTILLFCNSKCQTKYEQENTIDTD